MQSVVFGWLIYSHTKDPMALGLIGLAEAIPAISMALFGGHLADQLNRKKLILTFLFMLFLWVLDFHEMMGTTHSMSKASHPACTGDCL